MNLGKIPFVMMMVQQKGNKPKNEVTFKLDSYESNWVYRFHYVTDTLDGENISIQIIQSSCNELLENFIYSWWLCGKKEKPKNEVAFKLASYESYWDYRIHIATTVSNQNPL